MKMPGPPMGGRQGLNRVTKCFHLRDAAPGRPSRARRHDRSVCRNYSRAPRASRRDLARRACRGVAGRGSVVLLASGLTLSHYDAKGHLVVARRILDSLTPGWKQIGAVWLPLPHLLNMLPVQVDLVLSHRRIGRGDLDRAFAVRAWCDRAYRARARRLASPAAIAAVFFALNPNLLYLQSTPMTEPLLLGLLALA